MENRYLTTVLDEMKGGIEKLKDLKMSLNEFLIDSIHMDWMNVDNQVLILKNALKSVDESIFQVGLVKDFVEEEIDNGRSN